GHGGHDDGEVGEGARSAEDLVSGEPIAVAVTLGGGVYRKDVGPGVRLGQREAAGPLAAHHRKEVLVELLGGGMAVDVAGAQRPTHLAEHAVAEDATTGPDLLLECPQPAGREALPPVLGRQVDTVARKS